MGDPCTFLWWFFSQKFYHDHCWKIQHQWVDVLFLLKLGFSSQPFVSFSGVYQPKQSVDGRNPANQLRLVVDPIIYMVLYITGVFFSGFLNHQQINRCTICFCEKITWWFQIFFICTPICGKFLFWRAYFSDGLKPPTRPRKINMEPENTPLEEENHLPNHHFQFLC